MRAVSILGSTGSVGTQTLEVVDLLGDIKVLALTANSNTDLLMRQIYKYKPEIAAVMEPDAAYKLKKEAPSYCKIYQGMDGILRAAEVSGADMAVNALVGGIGLLPSLCAINAGKDIAIANKEALVVGGELVMDTAREKGARIFPIDSEHSAVFQCINGSGNNAAGSVRTVYLTASGGPFFGYSRERLLNVTVSETLAHPNWSMGKKITVDCATLMNKGFEVIEAKHLFDISPGMIKPVIHRQSVIHSMVEFTDGSVMAQMGRPDMRVPISYAVSRGERISNDYESLDFIRLGKLTFEEADYENFPCLKYAYDALSIGGAMPCVVNYANESAVNKFLNGEIGFLDIPMLIKNAMDAYTEWHKKEKGPGRVPVYSAGLNDIKRAEDFTKSYCEDFGGKERK